MKTPDFTHTLHSHNTHHTQAHNEKSTTVINQSKTQTKTRKTKAQHPEFYEIRTK